MKMRIEQNLLRRNPLASSDTPATNGHHHHLQHNHLLNGNGLYNSNNVNNNNNTTTTNNNKRNQGKEVGQDIPARKSALQETVHEEKSSFLNPELQRELNRILAEAESDSKLSHDSDDSSASATSSSVSSSGSEEEDEYEHPRRLFLEEIAEEDEEDLEEDDEVEEEAEQDSEDLSEGECSGNDLDIADQKIVVDDKAELLQQDEVCSGFASDSDATITNECIEEEIGDELFPQNSHQSSISPSMYVVVPELFSKERTSFQTKTCEDDDEEEVEDYEDAGETGKHLLKILPASPSPTKVEKKKDDDSKSAVENEWGNEQIDEAPKETSAEHARGETGISTETDYEEPVVVVESEQQQQHHHHHHEHYYRQQPHCFNHLHYYNKEKYAKQPLHHDEDSEWKRNATRPTLPCIVDATTKRESTSEVSQQPLKFLHEHSNEQDQAVSPGNTSSVGRPPFPPCTELLDEEDDEDEDGSDDDDDESVCSGSSSSLEALDELDKHNKQQQCGRNIEIRLFHDVGCGNNNNNSNGTEQPASTTISREWSRESKCRDLLVDLEATTSTEVHDLVPESPGESGTGSSSSSSSLSSSSSQPSSPSSSASAFPLNSRFVSSTTISRSYLLPQEEQRSKGVSAGDSCTKSSNNSSNSSTTTSSLPRLPISSIVKSNSNSINSIARSVNSYPSKNQNKNSNSKVSTSCTKNNNTASPPLKTSSSLPASNSSTPVISFPSSSTSSPFPSILITSPKPSPSKVADSISLPIINGAGGAPTVASVHPKKKRVSFQEHVESKTFYLSDEPSSVSSSNKNCPSENHPSGGILKEPSSANYSSNQHNNVNNHGNSGEVYNHSGSGDPSSTIVVEQELNSPSASASTSNSLYATNFYSNSQFSATDFWAVRNGGAGGDHQQYLQSLYYSESENISPGGKADELSPSNYSQQHHNQKQQRHQNNHHYYYPTEYFTLSDNFAQNGLPPVEHQEVSSPASTSSSSSVVSANQFWKIQEESQQQQHQKNRQDQSNTDPSAENNSGARGSTKGPPSQQQQQQTSPTKNNTSRPTSVLDNNRNAEMHQRLSGGEQRLRSVLRKPGVGGVKKTRGERSVTFNESLNLFYEAECSCWIHEDDYARLRQEEQAQQQQHHQQHHHHHQQFIYEQTHPHFPHTHQNFIYEPPPIEFEDPPTLSPPEGYKDRFFPQEDPTDPDVTRVGPPSPPSARRKVFLKENSTDQIPPPPPQQKGVILNGLEDEEEDEESKKSNSGSGNSSSGSTSGSKGSRLGGILKGGRLWRSNSAEGKKVTSPPDEPDVVKCTESRVSEKDPADKSNTIPSGSSSPQNQVQSQDSQSSSYQGGGLPQKVSTGTAPLRTSEQIRLAVDSTLRLRTKKTKPECSSLVEKLRWLTSLDDDDPSDSSSQSGFATWPSRDKNGSVTTSTSSKKSDAGTSTNEEFVNSAGIRQPPPIYSSSEAKIKQISYTLEDIDEGLKGSEIELESFITEDGGRIERLKKRYSGEEPGDDYGFSRRPSVKGIKPKFSSTNQIFAQYTAMRASGTETPVPVESQYENTRGLPPPVSFDQLPNHLDGARMQLNYDVQNATGRPPEESRAHFEMIRQSFEHAANFSNFNRPHSWSVSTLPHPHHAHAHSNSISLGSTASPVPPQSAGGAGGGGQGVMPQQNLLSNNFGSTLSVSQGMQQPQNNLSMNPSPINMSNAVAAGGPRAPDGVPMIGGNPTPIYGTLPSQAHMAAAQQNQQVAQPGQAIYGTVRRVPNVIGRPLFLHYGALSVEAHPNKIVQPFPRPTKVPETPSPTQQPPPLRYYGPPIRYYNSPPPVPPRSVTTSVSGGGGGVVNSSMVPGNGIPPSANQAIPDCQQERGVPEGATDEEPSIKESYSMNV